MGEHVIRLPDVGEGVAEAELVEWHVEVGDLVREDTVLAAVMTDKATVEIPSPVEGEILWLGAAIGDRVPVGSPLIRVRVAGEGNAGPREGGPAANGPPEIQPEPSRASEPAADAPDPPPAKKAPEPAAPPARSPEQARAAAPRPQGEKPVASPAVRLRARESGIDLRFVPGSGPAGRITHEDLDAFVAAGPAAVPRVAGMAENNSVEEIRIVGLRRKIAEKMALSRSRIPHITYVEEVDVTEVEALRAALNKDQRQGRPKLTFLPFLMRSIVRAVAEQPGLNAHFDDEAGILRRHGGVHIGIATQTPAGLVVTVVRHAEARDLWGCAAEVSRLAEAARAGTATREELSGSTITITSLGAMGGVVTTPLINHPEVAIVGVNKMSMRPVWDGTDFVPRRMMNLSSSFDHRVVDGWDAAVFVQRLKALIETPAMIFVDG